MLKSKSINKIILLIMFILSTITIYLCVNYLKTAYTMLPQIQHIVNNMFLNYKIIIFVIEMAWLFSLYNLIKKYDGLKFPFIITIVAFNLIYIIWRIKYTIPTNTRVGMTLGIILIICELIGFFQSAIYILLFYKPYTPPPPNVILSARPRRVLGWRLTWRYASTPPQRHCRDPHVLPDQPATDLLRGPDRLQPARHRPLGA